MDLLRMPPSFKPTFAINSHHNCGEIKLKNESILCDTVDMVTLMNNKIQNRDKAINILFKFICFSWSFRSFIYTIIFIIYITKFFYKLF